MTDIGELLGVLAHEMRTPIAAILGYQELLAEGIYGSVDEKGQEPLDRIGYSARQLLNLIDGVQQVAMPSARQLEPEFESIEPIHVLRGCLRNAESDATGRSVKLESDLPHSLPEITTSEELLCRTLDLAIAAAVKTSHGATLRVSAHDGNNALTVKIENTGLDPARDNPDLARPSVDGKLTGAGLRLAIVREITHKLHGDVELQPADSGTTLILHFASQI